MGQNWAIAIGINSYRNVQRLQFAKRDAEAMRDYFQHEVGFQQIYHFSDDSPPIRQDYGADLDSQPTYATLRRFLRVRFEDPFLQSGDNLWFFFAGHGMRHEDRDYLMPIDGDPGDVENTAIPLHYVTERLRRCGADNVVLLIDACRNATGRRDGLGIGNEKQQGVITLFSCSPNESSYEIEALQQGAFTYALLESLRLQGEGNCATVERLYQRLRHQVPQLSQRYQKPPQTPYGFIEPPSKYHLILLPRQATLADVMALKYDAVQAEIRRDYQLAKQLWVRVLSVSFADSEAIEGIERLAQISANPSPPPTPPSPPPTPSPTTSRSTAPPPPSPLPVPSPTFEFKVVTIERVEEGRLGTGSPKVITKSLTGRAEYYVEELSQGVNLEMVSIPGGSFKMGSPEGEDGRSSDESPQHSVTVNPFWMGKYPVTQAQWRSLANLPKVERDLDPDPSEFKGDRRPVEQVSWDDAVEFCARLSNKTGKTYRLPSEAEWEYACRAGTTTPFHVGQTITTDLANYNGNRTYGSAPKGIDRQQTTDVGSFPANAFGLYDIHGNVWEWCLDHWHDTYQGAPTDGSAWTTRGDTSLRLVRGGSWGNVPRSCRSAYRNRFGRDDRYSGFGFRLVCLVSRILP